MEKTLAGLKAAVAEFNRTAEKMADFGACDTEPLAVFQSALIRAINGEVVKPIPAKKWELYTVSMNCTAAAAALNKALAKVVKIANALSDSVEARSYVREICSYYLLCVIEEEI